MILEGEDALQHYGILRKSGRYPWGSGEDPVQRSNTFLGMVADLREKGLTPKEIAVGLGLENTTNLRNVTTIARAEKKAADVSIAIRLKEKGMSNIAIGKQMGVGESQVRALLKAHEDDNLHILKATTEVIKKRCDEVKYLDVGTGQQYHVPTGVSENKFKAAIAALEDQGYKVHYLKVPQLGTTHETTHKVLAPPGVPYSEVSKNRDNIRGFTEWTNDGGRSWLGIDPPISISSKRLGIRYKEEGGAEADGVIYVRPGVRDISLGRSRYAQVRIQIDDTHYIKGMAMYKDDLPSGTDLLFNTNKSNTGNKLDALKPLKNDPDNPFGSTVRQLKDENKKVYSAMNIVYEEGTWERWSNKLSSQFLSKQTPDLVKKRLDLTFEKKKSELDEIMKLTNPAVRKHLLFKFAEEADSSAVHLKAAGFKRSAAHVILPITSMKETEIYAPNFKNGERVVLIRHPHAGVFEIPELTVNNRHPEARKLLGPTKDRPEPVRDAVGIHPKVAQHLSGADFDGDTVLVIPNNDRRIKNSPPLAGLKDFDPQIYKIPDDSPIPRIKPKTKQLQMGDVSNLITDMTIKGAPPSELARAVRHSMVVIDAEKHHLNYKQSAIDNGISQLKKRYQTDAAGNPSSRAGASTLISRAKSRKEVPERKQGFKINPETGAKEYRYTGATKIDAKGRVVPRTTRSTKMAETNDARTLLSKGGGTKVEHIYADYANRLKTMANDTRKEYINTKPTPYDSSARTAYSKEVASLNAKLHLALRNSPLERQAQVLGNRVYKQKLNDQPDMDESEKKKVKAQALMEARTRVGAHKEQIKIDENEWAAIQAGAFHNNTLTKILDNADLDTVRKLATPKETVLMTNSKTARAQSMLKGGATQAEVAEALGVSLSTLKRSLGGEG